MPAWINLGAVPVGQAGIEGGDERILVHVTADDAQARHAVARLVVPNLHDLGVLVDDLLLLALGRRIDKQAVLHQAHLVAGLLKHVAHVRTAGLPQRTLDADDLVGPLLLNKIGELLQVKRLAARVHKGLDVVLEHLGVVVLLGMLHGLDPGGGVVGAHKVEAVGVEQLLHGDLAVLGLDNHGVLLQAAHDSLELGDLLRAHGIGLVEDQRGAKLDLLDEQALDVVLVDILGQQVAAAVELVVHAGAIDHSHDVVECKLGLAAHLGLVAEARDGVGDGDGLANARGLDDDVIEVARIGDALQLVGQVVRKRAANAAVGERDEVVGLGKAAVGDKAGVDVDLADIVDDHGGADAAVVSEDVVEQRGLAGTEVSGKHDDLHGFVGHVPSFVRHGLQLNLMPNACSYTHAPANNTGYSQAPHTSGQ